MRSFSKHRERYREGLCESHRAPLTGGRNLLRVVALSAVLGLGACTTVPGDRIGDENDPFEPVNRAVFTFNDAVDRAVLRPVSRVYREVVPRPVRDSVHNLLTWLKSPVILANSLFQGDFEHAGTTLIRFTLNGATLGLADIAGSAGYEHRPEDFGQTLGQYGMPEGPYLVLPFIGPSTLRDAGGRIVDHTLDPLSHVNDKSDRSAIATSRATLQAIDFRVENYNSIDELRADSLDFYTKIRTIYRQQRKSAIRNGQIQTDDMDIDLLEESEFDLPDASPVLSAPASSAPEKKTKASN